MRCASVITAVELPNIAQLVVVRGQPVRMVLTGPAGAEVRPDGQRPELVEREHPIRGHAGDVLDPGEFRVTVRIIGFLPGFGPLKGDVVLTRELPQPLPADDRLFVVIIIHVVEST
jgi:hypothetical protein